MKGEDFHAGYSDGDVDTNFTANRDLNSIVAERYSRRQTVMGGLKTSSAAFLGTTLLAACDNDIFGGGNAGPAFFVNAGGSITTTAGNLVTLNGSVNGTAA